jgi:uncharacterized protein YheU (UPF0270 family)
MQHRQKREIQWAQEVNGFGVERKNPWEIGGVSVPNHAIPDTAILVFLHRARDYSLTSMPGQTEDDAPIRVAPDDLAPETLRAVIESFILREGTDYGLRESLLDDKVAQVLAQLRSREAYIVFDPGTESVSVVLAREIKN